MEKNDEELIAAHIKGDETALSLFVARYFKPIYHFAYRLSGNIQDAEDITQETFVKVWRHAHKYHQGEQVKTWLFTIAHNSAIDLLRKRKRLVFSDLATDETEGLFEETLVDTEPLPDAIFAKAEEKEFIENLLLKLSPLHQEVLHLYYTEELTFDEIGKVLEKSINTVKSQHRRALLALRKLIEATE